MKTNMPKIVKIASWIWLTYGVILFIGAISIAGFTFSFIFNSYTDSTSFFDIPFIAFMFFILLLSFIFLYMGWQTLKGKAKDTFGSGLGSIVFALLGMLSFLSLFLKGKRILSLNLIYMILLLLAGVFALIGRKRYKEWILNKKDI